MEEWKEYKLGDVCSRLKSGKGISSSSILENAQYPVIGGNGIRGYVNTANFKGECAVIGRQGAYCGNVRYFNGEAYMTEHAVVAVGNSNVNTRYLACLLARMQLGNLSAQSAQPGLSVQILSKLLVKLPPLYLQNKIAAVVKSIDDKIELNRRINDNLEQQAQALFKSWFVDFEPWGGKMPDDWRKGNLGDVIIEVESGSRPKGGAEILGIPSIGAEKIESFGAYNYSGEKYVSVDFYSKMKRGHVKDGDVMLYKDGAYTGKCSMALDGFPYENCAVNEHVFLLRTRKSKYQLYLYLTMTQAYIRSMIHTLACAKAAQPGLNTSELLGVETIVPTEDIMAKFNSLVFDMMHAIANNAIENHRLAQLRDTLLPKLMSGELKIS